MRIVAVPFVLPLCLEWLILIPFLLTPFQSEEKGNLLLTADPKCLISKSIPSLHVSIPFSIGQFYSADLTRGRDNDLWITVVLLNLDY